MIRCLGLAAVLVALSSVIAALVVEPRLKTKTEAFDAAREAAAVTLLGLIKPGMAESDVKAALNATSFSMGPVLSLAQMLIWYESPKCPGVVVEVEYEATQSGIRVTRWKPVAGAEWHDFLPVKSAEP